jgi:hypothetical protein
MLYKDFNNAVKEAGKETALLVRSRCENWFLVSLNKLIPIIEEHNNVLSTIFSSTNFPPSIATAMCDSLRSQSKHVKF